MPRGALFDNDKTLLSLALIPFKRPRDGMEPICTLFVGTYSGEWVLRRSDFYMVSLCMEKQINK